MLRVRDVQGGLQLGDLLRALGPAVLRAALPQAERQPLRVVPPRHRGPVPRGRGPAEVPPGLLPVRRLRRRAARRLLRRRRQVVLRARRLAADAVGCPRAAAADGPAAAAAAPAGRAWHASPAGRHPEYPRAAPRPARGPVVEPPSSVRIAHGPEADARPGARARRARSHAEDGEADDEARNDVTGRAKSF